MKTPILATYRLQFHRGFTFDDAAAAAAYLADLGITHAYCSPYLQAANGSTHGYDVIDHSALNRELGGEAAFARFVKALRAHRLGHVADIVPNHMAISTAENRWWADVLENGPSSQFAAYFDVDWDPPEARLRNTVLIPVLGEHYGRAVENGQLAIARDGGRFHVRYTEHSYPLSPSSLGRLLGPAAREAASETLAFLADAFAELPRPTATDRASVRRRHRDKEVLRELLERLLAEDPAVAGALDAVIDRTNRDPDALHALLEMQNYRLAWWRSAGWDLGYRRFFDVDTLIGLRVEDDHVFQDTHERVLRLVREGLIDGLRVDHPDGLRDPLGYLQRLRAAAPETWIVVEKVLEPAERLPDAWPISGTTGYDFLNRVAGLFVDPAAEVGLDRFYAEFTGEPTEYRAVVHDKKLYVLREVLGSDVNRLTDLLLTICEQNRAHRDYSRHQLADALRELVACFPVYRTYVRSGEPPSDADRQYVTAAFNAAVLARPDIDGALFHFLRGLLLLETEPPSALESEFVARFQQLTGPAMAKGVEDTAFYTFNRFVMLNEVGGNPCAFGTTPEQFHTAAVETQRRWPLTMVATATHDTKRGEDVRMRLAVLSERPGEWIESVRRWSARTAAHRTGPWPDRNSEYLFYQTLVGGWPLTLQRMTAYMEKATREAKGRTSWTSPNHDYDAAVRRFVEGSLNDRPFMDDVCAFVERLLAPGRINALAQTLIKLTAPGVPDLYQGTELWSLDLVDPDNRRPVDYDERRRLLSSVEHATAADIWRRADSGAPKLWVIRQALHLRRRCPAAFGPAGRYTPLDVSGEHAGHVVAFARGGEAATVVPRLTLRVNGDWRGTLVRLPDGQWRNVLTGESCAGDVRVEELWHEFPVALLERELHG